MKFPICPICQNKTGPFPAKNLPLFCCFSCQLIFQTPSKKEEFTPNERIWGEGMNRRVRPEVPHRMVREETDSRLTKTTYQMKKQTFRILFKTLSPYLSNLRNLGNLGDLDRLSLLDIGTGTGALLEVAGEFGFQAIGLEPDNKFTQKGRERGLNIVNYTIEKSDFKPNSFDIVTMFDVLEHMQDLDQTMKKITQLLKPNGLFVVSTPNTDSLSFKLMGSHWPHFKKEHIFYFSPKSLKLLLEKHGFTIVKIANSLKALNLNYIAGYFTAFKNPLFTPLSKVLATILPKFLTQLPINLPNGNMLVIAKKIK